LLDFPAFVFLGERRTLLRNLVHLSKKTTCNHSLPLMSLILWFGIQNKRQPNFYGEKRWSLLLVKLTLLLVKLTLLLVKLTLLLVKLTRLLVKLTLLLVKLTRLLVKLTLLLVKLTCLLVKIALCLQVALKAGLTHVEAIPMKDNVVLYKITK
jgi:hypothetical protein